MSILKFRIAEWQSRGFHDFPSTQGVVLLAEDLTAKAFREKLIEGDKANPQKMMTDQQWEYVKAVLGGTLPSKEPRPVSTGTPPDNPIRVIRTIESQLKILDKQQQKVAFEYACRFHYATLPLSWKQDEREIHKRNEAFVALTRARVWCVVTGVESPIFDEIRQALKQYPEFTFPAFNKKTIERNNDENENEDEEAEKISTQPKLPQLV